jgi:hypothetical protein
MKKSYLLFAVLVSITTVLFVVGCGGRARSGADLNASDFKSIQAALDALPETGGSVTVPTGIHPISEPIRIRGHNVSLRGLGRASVILNQNREGEPAILARSDGDPEKNPLWGITVSNMLITGDETVLTADNAPDSDSGHVLPSGDGILADHCNQSLFDKLWLSGNGGNGLNLYYCYENPRVSTCQISYNRSAGLRAEGCHDIVVSACQFEENFTEGILALDGFNLTASGNNIDDHRGDGMVLVRMGGSTLSGNMVEESVGWGLVLRDCFGTAFSAGLIRHNFTGGILCKDSRYGTVSGCVFEGNDSLAVHIDSDSHHNNVNGNTMARGEFKTLCRGFLIEGAGNAVQDNILLPVQGPGLILSGTEQNISGNSITSFSGPSGILLRGLKNSSIKDNRLIDRSGGSRSTGKITRRGSNSNNSISGNN